MCNVSKAAIYIREMPKHCAVCQAQMNGYCMGTRVQMGMALEVSDQVIAEKKPNWCPIEPISDKPAVER